MIADSPKKVSDKFWHLIVTAIVSAFIGASFSTMTTAASEDDVKLVADKIIEIETRVTVNETKIATTAEDIRQIKIDVRQLLLGLEPVLKQVNRLDREVREIRSGD